MKKFLLLICILSLSLCLFGCTDDLPAMKEILNNKTPDEILNGPEENKNQVIYLSSLIIDENNTQDKSKFSLILYADTENVSNVKEVIVRTLNGTYVNANVQTYDVADSKAKIVIIKSFEENADPKNYAVSVKLYNGEETMVPIINDNNKIIKRFAVQSNEAKYGDIVKIKDNYYYMMQSGEIHRSVTNMDEKSEVEKTYEIVLLPLTTPIEKLTNDDFKAAVSSKEFLDSCELYAEVSINDASRLVELKNTYGTNVEVIQCIATIRCNIGEDTSELEEGVSKFLRVRATYDEYFALAVEKMD